MLVQGLHDSRATQEMVNLPPSETFRRALESQFGIHENVYTTTFDESFRDTAPPCARPVHEQGPWFFLSGIYSTEPRELDGVRDEVLALVQDTSATPSPGFVIPDQNDPNYRQYQILWRDIFYMNSATETPATWLTELYQQMGINVDGNRLRQVLQDNVRWMTSDHDLEAGDAVRTLPLGSSHGIPAADPGLLTEGNGPEHAPGKNLDCGK